MVRPSQSHHTVFPALQLSVEPGLDGSEDSITRRRDVTIDAVQPPLQLGEKQVFRKQRCQVRGHTKYVEQESSL